MNNPWTDRIGGAVALLLFLIICHVAVTGWIDESYEDNIRQAQQAQKGEQP